MGKVYVMGAGASRALNSGAPFMVELLPEALKISSELHGRRQSIHRIPDIMDFLQEFFHEDLLEGLPPFEDILSQLDYCLLNNLPLSSKYKISNIRALRKNLIYLIGRVIQLKTQNSTNRELCRKFLQSLQIDDSIISLNYDLIIDNAWRSEKRRDVNYGVLTGNLRDVGLTQASQVLSDIAIYKLHGSLNWVYCPVCQTLLTVDGQKAGLATLTQNVGCLDCHTLLEPLLITPSFLKDYNNSFIVQLWREAQTRLHKADEVIFVGYSIPDADIVLRLYFSRAIYTNRLINNRPCKIRIVDLPRAELLAKRPTDVEKRYQQLFGSIDYDPTGFEEYIKRECRTVYEKEIQDSASSRLDI